MSKLDQYMQGRTEGMEFALRLAKDKGIEELEKEVRFRNRTGVSLNLTRQESGCITGHSDITKLSGNHGEAWQHLGR